MQSVADHGYLVIYGAYGLVGLATFVVTRLLFQEYEARAAAENLQEMRERSTKNFLLKITRPFFAQYIVPMIRGKPVWENRRKISKRKLISAGLKEELTPDEFLAFKFFSILTFPILAGLLKALGLLEVPLWSMPLVGAVGWFYPDLWVFLRIKERRQTILRALPFIVDLLTLSTEAGLDFVGAIGKVVEKAKASPLIDELSQLLKEIRLGASRQDALREMAIRIDTPEVNSFVAILISSDQMGASIGKVLRQQADQMRVDRMLRAEKAGAAAAQKVLFPLVLCFLPAVGLLALGPVFLSIVAGGGR